MQEIHFKIKKWSEIRPNDPPDPDPEQHSSPHFTKPTKRGENPMNVNYFKVSLPHKVYSFIKTESRFFEISESRSPVGGPVLDAVPVPDSTVADIVGQAANQQKSRGKASRIRSLQKEEAI